MCFSKLEYDYDIYTEETERTKTIAKEFAFFKDGGNCFLIEEDEDTRLYLVIYFDYEDFIEKEDEEFYDTFINSSFGSMLHVTCYDGSNEIYKFLMGTKIDDVIEFFNKKDIISDIENITNKWKKRPINKEN